MAGSVANIRIFHSLCREWRDGAEREGSCHDEVLLWLQPSADHQLSAGPRNQCLVVINHDILNNLENKHP